MVLLGLVAATVSDRGIADPTWHLVRSGGARAPASVTGLQLVPLIEGPGPSRPPGR